MTSHPPVALLNQTFSSSRALGRIVSGVLAVAVAAAVSLAPSGAFANEPREAVVAKADDKWEARLGGSPVYSGANLIEAIQAAADGLTPGRDWKETVHVRDSGTVSDEGAGEGLIAVRMPAYTILDFHGNTVHVRGGANNTIIPVRAQDVQQIEVRNLRVTGNPRFGIFMKGCQNVVLAGIRLSLGATEGAGERGGAGIRTEGGDRPWSGEWNRDFVLEDIFVEETRGHGVELWRTDGLKVGTITTRNTGYAGVLLNQTRNARIELVDAFRANHGGGYAGFRTANDAGPNIEVDKVIAIECGRGVFTVSGSHGITIHEVEIARSSGHGMLIEDTENFVVNGGAITDCGAEGVRITSRRLGQGPGSDHHPASNVTIQNLRISGSPWGIRETLPRTHSNRILNNDLRGNANCLEHQGEGTVAEGNICD
jgi:hypothetical protein